MPRPQQNQSPSDRLPFLEGLRGLAALYVVLGHICSMADPSKLAGKASSAPYWLQAVMSPFQYGHLAVAAFIVLSGFCLQLALFTRSEGHIGNLSSWFGRRARRILPAYYGALALSMIVVSTITVKQTGMPFEHYLPVTDEALWSHIFLVHNLSQDWMYKINGVMWSIGIEAQLYILFPLLVLLSFKVGRAAALAVSIVAAVAVLSTVPGSTKLYAWYLPLFSLGMVAANFAYRPSLKFGVQPLLAGLLALTGFVVAGYACHHGWPIYICDSLLGVGVAAVCYWMIVSSRNLVNSILGWRPLVALGGFSYSLYLIHHPLQQIAFAHRPSGTEGPEALFWYLLAAALPAILVGSWLFSLVFERPWIKIRAKSAVPVARPQLTPTSLPLQPFSSTTPSKLLPSEGESMETELAATP